MPKPETDPSHPCNFALNGHTLATLDSLRLTDNPVTQSYRRPCLLRTYCWNTLALTRPSRSCVLKLPTLVWMAKLEFGFDGCDTFVVLSAHEKPLDSLGSSAPPLQRLQPEQSISTLQCVELTNCESVVRVACG